MPETFQQVERERNELGCECLRRKQENKRLRTLVKAAYFEGYGHGFDDVQKHQPPPHWDSSKTKAALVAEVK